MSSTIPVTHTVPTVVLGSGIAGLTYALGSARHGEVLILTKKHRADSNTNWAQGGLAAVVDPSDSFDLHVEDTLTAGAGLCRRDVVELVVREGPRVIEALRRYGAHFTETDGGELDLGMEGGHHRRRIVHAHDHTGHEIEKTLLEEVARHPNIRVLEHHFALDLWTGADGGGRAQCYGVLYLDQVQGTPGLVRASHTMLATGGCGKVYLYTTNPDIATADGVAMAARAGCPLGNMEMVQFHPTCLYHPEAKSFLVSEAVRGEGAVLRNLAGDAFMEGRHELGSLAPRDIVAREIDREMKRRGDKHVLLDVSEIGRDAFLGRFPSISAEITKYGLRPGVDPIPVVPAAHYMCGGVLTDNRARTSLAGLFAAGEVACSGVHGANRLASNSLLEASALSTRAAKIPPPPLGDEAPPPPPAAPGLDPPLPDQGVILDHEWDAVRRLMWDYVGLVRSHSRLDRAVGRLRLMKEWADELYGRTRPSEDLAELRNIATVGLIMATAADARRESRGLHSTVEYPETDPVARESWARLHGDDVAVELRGLPNAR